MSNKFELRIFPNGRVVFIKSEDVTNAIEKGKELLVVCNSWSGGYALAIGANFVKNGFEDENGFHDIYDMYSYNIKDTEFTPDDLKKFYKVIFTSGSQIMMETGEQANMYQSGKFIDYHSNEEQLKKDIEVDKRFGDLDFFADTNEEILRRRKTVATNHTLNILYSKDKKDIIEMAQLLIDYRIVDKKIGGEWIKVHKKYFLKSLDK